VVQDFSCRGGIVNRFPQKIYMDRLMDRDTLDRHRIDKSDMDREIKSDMDRELDRYRIDGTDMDR
jgi:hypothetical protein